MERDFMLWLLALVRAAIVAAAVVLLVFLAQELLLPHDGPRMQAPALFYAVQDWIEQTLHDSYSKSSSWVEQFDHVQRRQMLVACGASALTGLTLVVSWFLYTSLIKPYMVYRFLKKQGLKGVTFRPFIGQLPEMRAYVARKKRDPEYAALLFPQASEAEAKWGTVYLSQIGTHIRVVSTDPSAIKEVLVTKARSFEKTAFARRLLSVLGNGLVFSEGAVWERQRKMINPAFSHTKIKVLTTVKASPFALSLTFRLLKGFTPLPCPSGIGHCQTSGCYFSVKCPLRPF